jgi:peptidyl-tRNA hydrolase, PTH1 family
VSVRLIVGLGNPSSEYSLHRHNAGFRILDMLADESPGFWKTTKDFFYRNAIIENKEVILLKPMTYMNLSGNPVRKFLDKYEIQPSKMIVVHDELDIPVGELRVCFSRGHGGHNGVESIINSIGTKDFYRLRVGIGKPSNNMDISDYVLLPYSKSEKDDAYENEKRAVLALKCFITDGLHKAQTIFN